QLGEDAEIQPGSGEPDDAGPVNRADRAAASALLGLDAAPGTDLTLRVSQAPAELARRRPADGGLDAPTFDALLDREPPGRDDRAAFLTPASRARIARPIADEGLRGRPRPARPTPSQSP